MREITAAEVAGLLEPGAEVYVGGSSNEPLGLLEALSAAPGRARNVRFTQFPLAGFNETDLSALLPGASLTTFFMAPHLKAGAGAGRVRFLPMQMRNVYDYLSRRRFDVAMVQIMYDRDGRLRFGPNVDFTAAAMDGAGVVLAELNEHTRAPAGCPLVAEASIDAVLRTRRAPVSPPAPPGDAVSAAVGRHVATLIRDGDCLQTGIGAIPAAVLAALDGLSDLGLHSGLIDDAVMALIRAGKVTGRAKTRDRGVHVTGMALGSAALMAWLAEEGTVRFHGADYTHDGTVIRGIDNFVSINSAVEVDLLGQVNAETVGGRQISGTGGSVDFMRAARRSEGGRSIIAMTATARGNTVSRILPRVDVVTALRTDVDLVVTEHGIADLRDATVDERAARLIAIAHPDFRKMLSEHA